MLRVCILFFMLVMFAPLVVLGESLSLVTLPWEPYASEKKPSDLTKDIVKAACSRVDMYPDFSFRP